MTHGAKLPLVSAVLCCSLLAGLAAPLSAAPSEESLREALVEFPAARKGNEGAVKRTLGRLRALSRAEGESSTLVSFLGCVTAMQARHTPLVWKKLSLAKDGARIMDRAVNQNPEDLMARLVRAGAYVQFPSMLNKDPLLREDVQFLEQAFQDGIIPGGETDEALRVLIRYYSRTGDSNRCRELFAHIRDDSLRRELASLVPGAGE